MGRKATIEGREKRLEAVRKSIYNLERDLYESGVHDIEFTQFEINEEVEVEIKS